jgi:hypothetical protein
LQGTALSFTLLIIKKLEELPLLGTLIKQDKNTTRTAIINTMKFIIIVKKKRTVKIPPRQNADYHVCYTTATF